MTARVLITRRLPARIEAAAQAYDTEIRESPYPLTEAEAAEALQNYDAILPTLGDGFTAAAFREAGPPRAMVLANFGVGYNHIDVAAARAAGVVVTNTPGAVTDATADIALMLLLMSARRASEGERLVRAGRWPGWQPTQLLGSHVTGKTVGIIGFGRIGRAIAARCHFGFGMEIIFASRSAVQDAPVPARDLGSVAAVMAAADFVVIAVPGGAATRHLIDADALAAMQPHAHLINISRGDVIDETALIHALAAHRIAGAGLDVYEHEPQVPAGLIALENVTLLPHLGTASLEVREAMGQMAFDNLVAVIEGRAPLNPV